MTKNENPTQYPAAILFDHDGTLVDTEPLWEKAKQRIASEFGVTWTEQDTLAVLGFSIAKTLKRLQEVGVDLPLDQLEDRLISYMMEEFSQSTYDFLPGIRSLLDDLHEAGVPMGIVTNATTAVAQRTADLVPGYFSALIGDQETTAPKPDPQPYLLGAQALGVNPTDCIAIEDSPSGVRSALDAGMKVVVVPGEVAVPEELGHLRLAHENLSLDLLTHLSQGHTEIS